jgi:hypothetical protein
MEQEVGSVMVVKIIPMILAMMLLAGTASAMTPMPVGVFVRNEGNLAGYDIEQRNMRTGEIIRFETYSDGYNNYDWSNAKLGFAVGDDIKVTILDCRENPNCVRTVTIEPTPTGSQGGMPIKIFFELTGDVCPVCDVCQTCPTDTTPYKDCNSCCPTVVCPDIPVCPECPDVVCPAAEECPEEGADIVGTLFAGIIGLAGGLAVFVKLFNNKIFTGVRTGMKVYRGLDGNIKVYHKHPGTRGYHNPETSHRGSEAHPKGMIDVANGYHKVDGEWVYGGDK